jgi:hypothetical protein
VLSRPSVILSLYQVSMSFERTILCLRNSGFDGLLSSLDREKSVSRLFYVLRNGVALNSSCCSRLIRQ